MSDPYRQSASSEERKPIPRRCILFEEDVQKLKVDFHFQGGFVYEAKFEGEMREHLIKCIDMEGFIRWNKPEDWITTAIEKLRSFVSSAHGNGFFQFDGDYVPWNQFQRTEIIHTATEEKVVSFYYLPEKTK